MENFSVSTPAYFDGHKIHTDGPYLIDVSGGKIEAISSGPDAKPANTTVYESAFVMPGLVEAHCHIFLDGAELDFKTRSEYLKKDFDEMMDVARANVAASLASGITLIRDAGDRYGVNHTIRQEQRDANAAPQIRSPGLAIRRPKKYGAFMAREVSNQEEIIAAIDESAKDADDLKVILTGIIDFEAGAVNKPTQFDLENLKLIVEQSKQHGLKNFVHCSGLDGLELAVEAGVDSIEHGFFMTEEILDQMLEKGIAWVPTYSPVLFQWQRPELCKWDEQTVENLKSILDNHSMHTQLALQKGIELVAGSDAGSYGVAHGKALIDELVCFHKSGLPLDEILKSATSRPRKLWGCESNDITVGNAADMVCLDKSPIQDIEALYEVSAVYSHGKLTDFCQEDKQYARG